MPIFLYTGKTAGGAPVSGEIDGNNEGEVEQLLRRKRIIPGEIRKKPTAVNLSIGTGVGAVDISRFTRQFAVMIGAGLPLVQSLQILGEQSESKNLGKAILDIRDEVSGGSTLAAAMGKHKKIFDDLYVNMVEAGEVGGALDVILIRLADYREKADRLVRKVKGALMYPMIISIVCAIVTWILLTFVVPIFAGMFEGLGAELPKPTAYVLAASKFLRANIVSGIITLVVLIVAFTQYKKTPKGRLNVDAAMLKVPGFGSLIRKTAVSKFCRTLSTLMQSGVNLIEALNITAKTAGNQVIANAIHKSMLAISQGETITNPLRESGVFPPMVIQMINVGEATGGLDEMLSRIADFYDEEVDAAVEGLTSLIEPVVIVVMGIVVGCILVAMYLPMFDIIGKIS